MPGSLLAHGSRVLCTREPFVVGAAWRDLIPALARWDGRAVVCAALNGAGWALAAWRWCTPGELAAFAVLTSVLVVVAVIDTLHSRIPDRISLPSMVLAGCIALGGVALTGDVGRLLAVAVGTALFWGGLAVAHLVSPGALGRGDVKLAVTLGVALGWAAHRPAGAIVAVLAAFLCASAVGTLVGLVLLLRRRRSSPYPFGPALIIGALTAVLLADAMDRV